MKDLENRLLRMGKHWNKWAKRRGIEAYRVYDRDIPEYPYVVDIYGDSLVIAAYVNDTVTSRKNYEEWNQQVVTTIRTVLGFSEDKTFLKSRERQSAGTQYEKKNETGTKVVVSEGGLRFEVNPSDYLDSGLFADHRILRDRIRSMAAGKRFLNLFCYTGSFTVYAAAGGAQTVSVDTSGPYLEWLARNMQLNGIGEQGHEKIRDDVRKFLEFYKGPSFDIIFIDPPVFSRGKKLERDFDVARDHADLIENALAVLNPGGVLFFSTNMRKFRIQWKPEGSRFRGSRVKDITAETIPEDFRNKNIHTCYEISKD